MAAHNVSEQAPLLGDSSVTRRKEFSGSKMMYILSLLLLGEFLSNAEATIMFAVSPTLASQLGDLTMAGWLITAYTLGSCVAQPLYGKLSNIFGRKPVLLSAYGLATLGSLLSASSTAIWHMVVARAVTGVGGAGLMILSAIIVADSVPKREVAQYRAYINTASTLGRSLGGPVGGFILDVLGWPWVFWTRIPLFIISAILLVVLLEDKGPQEGDLYGEAVENPKSKLRRIDFTGALLLSACLIAAMLLINETATTGQGAFFWAQVIILLITLPSFILYELHGTDRPIFDLAIFSKTNVALSYLIVCFQSMAQLSLMYSVPLYFQTTQNASATVAGAHLVPAVTANAVGSLLAGYVIRKTGSYKRLLVSVSFVGATSFLLLLFRWNGNTSLLESLYIMPGGFATGMVQSASFVAMASFLDPSSLSMATGMFFLSSTFGVAIGVSAAHRFTQTFFVKNLQSRLTGPGAAQIIQKVTKDIGITHNLPHKVTEVVVGSFVDSLKVTYFFGFVISILPTLLAIFLSDVDL